jgi:hypothetical protein
MVLFITTAVRTSNPTFPYIHWIRGWDGIRTGLDTGEKINPLPLPGIRLQFLGHAARILVGIPPVVRLVIVPSYML